MSSLASPTIGSILITATLASRRRLRKIVRARLLPPGRPQPALAQHLVFLEPIRHRAPGVLAGILAVARPIVGVKAVRSVWIDLEFRRLAGGLERRLHRLHLRHRD